MIGRPGRADVFALCLLVVAVAAVHLPILLGVESLFFFDISSLNLPARDWGFRQIQAGEFPEWCSHWMCGFPYVAESQSGIYYPPNYLFFLTLPSWHATGVTYVVHICWAGVGAYLVFRRGASVSGSFIGALAFALGGRLLTHQIHAAIIEVLAWQPWIILSLLRYIQDGSRRALWWGVGAAGLQALAGSLQMTALCHLGNAIVAISAIGWGNSVSFQGTKRALAALAILSVGTIGLSVALWMPTAELLSLSTRSSGGTSEWANYGSLLPYRWVGLLFNGLFGSAAYATTWMDLVEPVFETQFYVSTLIPLLAIVGAFARANRLVIPLLVLSLVGISLIAGEAHLMGWGLRQLPVFSSVRIPARFLCFAGLGLCGLAAVGWDRVHNEASARRLLGWSTCVLLAAAISIAFWIYGDAFTNLGGNTLKRRMFEALTTAAKWTLLPSFASLVAVLFLLRPLGRVGSILVVLIVWCDLAWAARLAYPTIAPSFHAEPNSVAELRRLCEGDPARAFVTWQDTYRTGARIDVQGWSISKDAYWRIGECLYYERGPLFDVGIASDVGQLPLQTQRLASFRGRLRANERLMQLMGFPVRMSPLQRGANPDYRGDGCFLKRIDQATSHAYFCPKVRYVSPKDALDVLASEKTWPGELVLIEGSGQSTLSPGGRYTPAKSQWLGPNHLRVDIDAPADGLVVINEMDYPGWSARVNDRATRIERANYLFMAVQVAKGTNTIDLEFSSAAVHRGWWISLVCWSVWCLLGFLRWKTAPPLESLYPASTARWICAVFVLLYVASAVVRWEQWKPGLVTLSAIQEETIARARDLSR